MNLIKEDFLRIHHIHEEELVKRGLATKARSNCILASPRLAEYGIQMRSIEAALPEVMVRHAKRCRS